MAEESLISKKKTRIDNSKNGTSSTIIWIHSNHDKAGTAHATGITQVNTWPTNLKSILKNLLNTL